MYETLTGMGQTAATMPAAAHVPYLRRLIVGPRRVYAQGGGGRWYVTPRRGVGCACDNGLGQTASVSNVPSDITTLLSDLYVNSDGSMNWTAIALTAGVGYLLFFSGKRRR